MPDIDRIEKSRRLLQFVRGQALDAYSGLEQILMEVFCSLIEANLGFGGIVFFRLTNTGLRNKIFEELIERKYGTVYDDYWFGKGGLLSLIRQIDQRRNEVVHWKPVFEATAGEFVLRSPNLWNKKSPDTYLTIDNVCEFIAKCHCVRHYVGNFTWRTTRYKDGDTSSHARLWLDKFNHQPEFPPESEHPLFEIWREAKARPEITL